MTSNIHKLLATRLQYIRTVATKAAEYIDTVKLAIMGVDPGRYKSVMNSLSMLHELSDAVLAADWAAASSKNIDILRLSADTYQHFAAIDGHICNVVAVVKNESYASTANYNMSSTYVMGIYRLRNTILTAYEGYLDTTIVDDEEVFTAIFKVAAMQHDSSTPTDIMFAFVVENRALVNKFMIKLISHVISLVSGDRRRVIELIVEKQKDDILGASRQSLQQYAGVQGLVVRYNMQPVSKSMSLNDVFVLLGAVFDDKISLADNMKQLSNHLGTGVIMINKATSSPIEFNLSGLIDTEYIIANDLKTSPVSGLTKKIIDKFSTAVPLPRGGPADVIQQYSHGTQAFWHILESINGVLWRVMGIGGEKKIPVDKITGLLNGVTTRPHQYALMQSEKILSTCFNPHASMLLSDYEDMKTTPPSSEPIRSTILDRLCRDFDAKLKTINQLKNINDIRAISIDRNVINEVLLDVLTHSTDSHGKRSTEYLVTYISRFDGIIYDFIKKLERQWSNVTLQDRVFKENNATELTRIVSDLFRSTTQAAIDELEQSKTWTEYDISLKEFFLNREQVVV